jgi:16S rRNA (guanine527-N7)-methyltransferase
VSTDETYAAYLDAVRRSPHNLVSRRALEELETRHLPESRALAEMLPPGPARLVDIGSGGGFPGLVIAVARQDLAVTLVEATGKKADFLASTAADLGVDVEVIHGRIEDLDPGRLAGGFDLATARAVAPLVRLVAWTVPALRPGGLLYAVKGDRWREELEEAAAAITEIGAVVMATPDDRNGAYDGIAPRVVIIRRGSPRA